MQLATRTKKKIKVTEEEVREEIERISNADMKRTVYRTIWIETNRMNREDWMNIKCDKAISVSTFQPSNGNWKRPIHRFIVAVQVD